MTLSAGTCLGPYEILGPLGEGGMGVVYKANDTRLGRTVALKFVKAEFNQRWEREARAIAALNHPHIATLYDVGEHEGSPYLAMEYVKGAPLKGPCPAKEVIEYGIQMADALAAAHAAGIVHRDLKPGNILVTEKGSVKVLDFGLAKLAETSVDGATAATQTMNIAGTPGYIAPEQLNGKPADTRSDIFAFGCILYELVSGRRAFPGDTMAAALASTALAEPKPLDGAPERLQDLIGRCLRKDPERRQQSMSDARVTLQDIRDGGQTGLGRPAAQPARSRLAWIAAALFCLAFVALAVLYLRQKPAEPRIVRLALLPPENTVFTAVGGGPSHGVVSPDGQSIVFSATSTDGKSRLWVRALDSLAAQPLAGTDGARPWFWSPDSRSIGFYQDRKLKKIDAAGGPPLTLADARAMRGGSWSAAGVMVFAPNGTGPLMRVDAAGGAASPVTKLDRGENTHRFPWFLPDGRHFLFSAGVTTSDRMAIRAGSLDSTESRVLLEADSNAIYAQGYLLFLREATLMARPFDAGRLAASGEAAPVAEHVQRLPSAALGLFSASQTGFLAYRAGAEPDKQLTWIDRSGKHLATAGDPADLGEMHLSPDQKRAAVAATERNNTDIWIYDVASGRRTRFTFDPAVEREAVWSPDGRTIVFSSNRKGRYDLYRKASDGSGAEEPVYSDGLDKDPTGWSADGKFLLYSATGDPKTGIDIWVLPLSAGAKPYPLVQTPFNESNAQFSPDGRWVAYQSDESGQREIYAIPFGSKEPASGGKRQISTAGGVQVRWRRDGKGFFYIGPSDSLIAAEFSGKGGTLESGQMTALFGGLIAGGGYYYDAAADGQRFLVEVWVEHSTNAEPLSVVQNWTAGLKK